MLRYRVCEPTVLRKKENIKQKTTSESEQIFRLVTRDRWLFHPLKHIQRQHALPGMINNWFGVINAHTASQ